MIIRLLDLAGSDDMRDHLPLPIGTTIVRVFAEGNSLMLEYEGTNAHKDPFRFRVYRNTKQQLGKGETSHGIIKDANGNEYLVTSETWSERPVWEGLV
jgi:hypothetical protein